MPAFERGVRAHSLLRSLGNAPFAVAFGLERWETAPSQDYHYSLDFYRSPYIDVIFTVRYYLQTSN